MCLPVPSYELLYDSLNVHDIMSETGDSDFSSPSKDYYSTENFTNMTFALEYRHAFSDMFYRCMFIVLYSVIFVVCIIGNTLVLIVTAKSARMKTRTNFFLANLAAADLCVGVLCILPNLQTYLYFSWLLGKAMCKVYYFAESFSLCASVLLLTVIAVERYIAVMHPLKAKRLFTTCRMHTAQILIWVFAAVYNIPLLAVFDTFTLTMDSGEITVFCNIRDDLINLRLYFTMNFILWYALPLVTMCVVYIIISWTLWHSGKIFGQQKGIVTNNNPGTMKITAIVRDHRSTGVASSNSSYSDGGGSGGTGSVGETSQRESGRSLVCDMCRDASTGTKCRCHCGYSDEMSDRLLLNAEEVCERCGGEASRSSGSRSDVSGQSQFMFHSHDYGAPGLWTWSSGQDHSRGEDIRNFRQNSFSSRIFGGHGNKNTANDTDSLGSAFQLYQRGQSKRTSGATNQTLAMVTPKRRYASVSTSEYSHGHGSVYEKSAHRYQPNLSVRVLSSRRKVVRLLVLVLLTFAVCVLPHHVRLLMFYWNIYPESSFGMSFFPPLAFISMYLNSAMNPVLYSLFSESFRRSLRECLRRPCHRGRSFVSRVFASSCRNL